MFEQKILRNPNLIENYNKCIILTYLIYAHKTSVRRPIPIIRLHTFAIVYRPTRPNIPDKMYIVTAIAKNTAGVRAALKIFLLSLCALNCVKDSSKSYIIKEKIIYNKINI